MDRIRRAAAAAGKPVAIMQDLSGPKIRTGRLADGLPLQLMPGDDLMIEVGDFVGEPGRIATTVQELPRALKPGDVLLTLGAGDGYVVGQRVLEALGNV